MTAVPVRAYAFASTFKLRDLAPAFGDAEVRAVGGDELHAAWPDGATAICYDFGALVFFGGEAIREHTVAAILARVGVEPHAPLTEDLLVEVRTGAAPEANFDRVVVPGLTPSVRGVVALLLAQSVAMDYYEEDVAEILDRTGAITRDLATRGRLRGRVKDLVRFIGSCIQTKNGIIETLALFDKPDVTWEEEAIDTLFRRLREVLEIDDRFRALEYKLRMIQENMVLLVDLSRQRQTIFLETIFVLLILFEVGVTVWQLASGGAH